LFTITIRTSSRLPAAQVAEVSHKLSNAYQQARPSEAVYEIIYDPGAPTFDTYGQVGRAVVRPSAMIGDCYATYLGALAAGSVPEDIAYAAYLSCLNV
jgi:hypothetical protein